jgi:hypothetical protein
VSFGNHVCPVERPHKYPQIYFSAIFDFLAPKIKTTSAAYISSNYAKTPAKRNRHRRRIGLLEHGLTQEVGAILSIIAHGAGI